MDSLFSFGDLALSIAGRDKGTVYLVIDVDKQFIYCIDGKIRKIDKPKKKKSKHLEKVLTASLDNIAERIRKGGCVSNVKLHKAIKAQTKKQED